MARLGRRYGVYRLEPPVVVDYPRLGGGVDVVRVDLAVDVRTRPQQGLNRRAQFKLNPPVVVDPPIAYGGPGVCLTEPESANDLMRRRRAKPFLYAPVLVYAPPTARPIEGYLTPADQTTRRIIQRRTISRLPVVIPVTPPAPFVARPISTSLTRHLRFRPPPTHPELRPPAVVGPALVFEGLHGQLARTPHRYVDVRNSSALRKPIVVARPIYEGIRGQIARTPRAFLKTESRLAPPAVVTQPVTPTFSGPRAQLVRIRPARIRSDLFPPTVVDVFRIPYLTLALAYSRRGAPKSELRPPTDLVDQQDLGFVRIHLAASFRGRPKSRLSPPTVVFPFLARPTEVALARIRPRPTTKRLFPPTDTKGLEDQGRIKTEFAPQRRGRAKSILFPPPIIDLRPQAFYLEIKLTPSRRGVPKSHLGTPTDTVGLDDQGRVKTHLAYSRRGAPRSILFAPVVIRPVTVPPILTHLAPARRGLPKSRLFEPTVITTFVFGGPSVRLTNTLTANKLPRFKADYALRPPTVTTSSILVRPIRVELARIKPARTVSALRAPVLIDLSPQAYYLAVTLAPSRRGLPKSHLRTPTDTVGIEDQGRIRTSLTRIRPARTLAELRGPVVIDLRPQTYYITTSLAYSRRGEPTVHLFPPTDLVDRQDLGLVAVHLAPSRRGRPVSHLSPPTVVFPFLARTLQTKIAYSLRGKPKSRLAAPAIIDNSPQTVYLTTALAYSLRGKPKSKLSPAAVIGNAPQTVYLSLNTTYSRRGAPRSFYIVPSVVFAAATELGGILTSLAPSRRGVPKSVLRAPTAVTPLVFFASRAVLAPQRRGRARYVLRAPVVADLSPQTFYVTTALAPSRRGAPKSKLVAPTTVVVAQTYVLAVSTTYSRRGAPKSILRPPVVVGPVLARPIKTTLARIRPVRTDSVLRPPVVVYTAVEIYGPELALAPSRRGKPKPRLFPPTDLIDRQDLGFIAVHLAPSRRGRPVTRLGEPVVVFPFIARPIRVDLARIKPAHVIYALRAPIIPPLAPPIEAKLAVQLVRARLERRLALSRLAPPTVIDNSPQVYYPATTLAPSRRGLPKPFLGKPADTVGLEDQGLVKVTLTPGRRGRPVSRLAEPTVVFPFIARPTEVTFTRIRPQHTITRLAPPADTVGPEDQGLVKVTLAASFRGRAKSILLPPALIDLRPQAYYIEKTFARIRPRPTTKRLHVGYRLRFPDAIEQTVSVTLTRIKPQPIHSILRKPTVVAPVLARAIDTTLAPQRRGKAKPFLRKVIYDAKVYAPIRVELAPSRFGKPKSILRKPTVVAPFIVRREVIALAPQRRGLPKSFLGNVIYEARTYAPVRVEIAYSRRGIPKSFLRGTIYEARVYAPLKIELAPSTRLPRKPHAVFILPTVVSLPIARPIIISLAPAPKPQTKSSLLPPAVIAYPPFRPILVTLTRIPAQPPKSKLGTPTVVRAPFIARPISVTLVRITPAPVQSRLTPPVAIDYSPQTVYLKVVLAPSRRGIPKSFITRIPELPRIPGRVCGYDSSIYEVCGDDSADVVSGTDSTTGTVTGSTDGATVSGSDSGPMVSGSDEGGG